MMRSRGNRAPRLLLVLSTGCIGLILAFMSSLDLMLPAQIFTLLSILLLFYVGLEINRLRHVHPDRWLLNPVIVCSGLVLAFGYGLTNVIFLLPDDSIERLGWTPDVSPGMVKLMWLALIAAIAIFGGYWSKVAARLSRPALVTRLRHNLLPPTDRIRNFALPVLVVFSVGARLLQIALGLFGYSSSYGALIAHASITQYLSMASSLGLMALVLAGIQYNLHGAGRGRSRWFYWFYGILAVEIAFGFLSGFKSAVVMPMVVAAICQYVISGRIAKQWIVAGLLAILLAFVVIEPFRVARNQDAQFAGRSVMEIFDTMVDAPQRGYETRAADAGFALSLMGRSNLTYPGSFGVAFKDENADLGPNAPHFLRDIALAPAYAVVPRFLWADKPLGDLGLWYNQTVMGMGTFSSTAMGPVTYLYMAGGTVTVFIGFFLLGILQRILFFTFSPAQSVPGAIVLLAMLGSIGSIASSFDSILIALFRELPLLVILQFLVFKGTSRRSGAGSMNPAPGRVTLQGFD